MYLLIDPGENNKINLSLFNSNKRENFSGSGKSKDVLVYLDNFLNQVNLTKTDIKGIAVVVGEGRFTSTRIATVIANIFSLVEDKKLIAVSKHQSEDNEEMLSLFKKSKPGEYISAIYSGEPNIN